MLGDLESDLRRMMLPNTASSLRENKRNSLKDFVSVAGPLGVSHFLMLTATEKATYLRVAKAPRVRRICAVLYAFYCHCVAVAQDRVAASAFALVLSYQQQDWLQA
jgi:hypothetical protein